VKITSFALLWDEKGYKRLKKPQAHFWSCGFVLFFDLKGQFF